LKTKDEASSEEIKKAVEHPTELDLDEKKYWRKPKTFGTKGVIVTVPEKDIEEQDKLQIEKSPHDEIQYLLIKLGSDICLDVWVARNDLNKKFSGVIFKGIPNLKKELPRQFDEATNKPIEKIDVRS